ncbi:MAG TPA: Mur ligase family protein [Chloroflexota bacterium]|jgi:dihydrofolate synthase/folylpolyglutamate synthase|nr:Mur ligase family protein [Chloroflexota bacterium]
MRDDGEHAEQRALAWLFSLADQERGVGWNPRSSVEEQWKLGRTRALLDLADAPDRQLRVVLVAGTKGKSSTCSMLASVIDAHGLRVGLYAKPHVQSYRERVRIDGQAISPHDFLEATKRVRRLVAELVRTHPEAGEPTTFEVTTALAIDVFARARCEVAVVEVGLGGRLDATNALAPELSLITPISYDHTAILGRTLGAIATEKAGIMRRGRPALVAHQRPTALRALRRVARAVAAAVHVVAPLEHDVPQPGEHQRQNAALAIAAARCLFPVADDEIQHGLKRLRMPGRFEIMRGVVLDGAHNDASAQALARTLADYAQGRPISLVLGINRDKDARAVLKPLLPLATHSVWTSQAAGNQRALSAVELANWCRRLGATATATPDLRAALNAATAGGDVVCVTGSLALVGQARTLLGAPIPERLWD